MYRFDDALERSDFDVEHNSHKEIPISDHDEIVATYCNYADGFEVLPMVDANQHCARNAICLETTKS